MIPRHLSQRLLQAARQYPVLTVTGPRQSGKTTLVRAVFPDHRYVSLEAPDIREFAIDDPRGFLAQFAGQAVILDEAQKAPSLFSYLQGLVDAAPEMGRFVITGSQNFLLLEKISQSLAGRSAIHHLLPLAASEILGVAPLEIERIGEDLPQRPAPTISLFELLHRGFYPPIHDRDIPAQDWLGNYYRTYLERDVRELINIGDVDAFARFVRLCAGRCGQLLNLVSLANDCGISHATARRWLSTLEASFVVFLLRPYHQNFSKRLIKSPKLYFCDTGLLCYLLRVRDAEDLRLHHQRGAVFENFVIGELLKNFLNRGLEADLYFWRDSHGHEVDLVVDRGGDPLAVEIKSGETVVGDFFKGLEYWRGLRGDWG